MFETEDFKKQIQDAIIVEAKRNGLERYESSMIDYLQRLAASNEKTLMESEMKSQ